MKQVFQINTSYIYFKQQEKPPELGLFTQVPPSSYGGIYKYSCDGVSLKDFSIEKNFILTESFSVQKSMQLQSSTDGSQLSLLVPGSKKLTPQSFFALGLLSEHTKTARAWFLHLICLSLF